ncbi:MAG: spondin domain-containing protein [Proteobacteria bacterium]|nr:spondin domain-containing protein [Pseudomonadota bacterium]
MRLLDQIRLPLVVAALVVPVEGAAQGCLPEGACADVDVVCDGVINILDVQRVLNAFGASAGDPDFDPELDLLADGTINILDVQAVLNRFGETAAASRVVYEVEFDATWSQATHPTDFPASPHFSGLIGATHDDGVVFWEPGGEASLGIERMAELGQKDIFQLEVDLAVDDGDAEFVISGGGIAVSPDARIETFEISCEDSLVTLVSMIAPSPDWFVGVHGLPLYVNGWRPEIVVDLDPYDAGTDRGVTFTSPDNDTDPQDPISQITGFPFTGTPPLGTFTFRLLPESEAAPLENGGSESGVPACGLSGVGALLLVAGLGAVRAARRRF